MAQFSPPVRVALGKLGNVTFMVSTPERAAEVLLQEWPTDGGSKHLAARKAVLKALEAAGCKGGTTGQEGFWGGSGRSRDLDAGAAEVGCQSRL